MSIDRHVPMVAWPREPIALHEIGFVSSDRREECAQIIGVHLAITREHAHDIGTAIERVTKASDDRIADAAEQASAKAR